MSAFQTMYRQEFIAAFEQRQTLLRDSVTTEAQIKGNAAVFAVAGSGGATAVTRGVNGMIPTRSDSVTQVTATLVEWHDISQQTNFNIFASQGDRRSLMQQTTMSVMNRKIDSDIITTLNTGSVVQNSVAAPADMAMCLRAKTILGVAGVPFDGNITALITPAFEAYLLQATEFASADYVDARPLPNAPTAWSDTVKVYRWLGMVFVVHPNLPGVGTSAEKCFVYHKSAIGHAADTAGMGSAVGYNEEQDYSFARSSMYMGPALLQNSGVVVLNHDGSALAAGV